MANNELLPCTQSTNLYDCVFEHVTGLSSSGPVGIEARTHHSTFIDCWYNDLNNPVQNRLTGLTGDTSVLDHDNTSVPGDGIDTLVNNIYGWPIEEYNEWFGSGTTDPNPGDLLQFQPNGNASHQSWYYRSLASFVTSIVNKVVARSMGASNSEPGEPGEQGPPGNPGKRGTTGAAGAAGAAGATGPIGPSGRRVYGPPGEDGVADDPIPGPRGPRGAVGATGAGGATGSAGATGARGRMGQSIAGDDGETPDPIPGPRGVKGATGAAGAAGAAGATGAKGVRGAMGFAVSGEDGETPDPVPGPRGPRGATGAAGANGATGAAGKSKPTTPPPDDLEDHGPFGPERGHSPTYSKNLLVPRGAIVMWGGAAAPIGWMLCQGGTLKRTEPLFAVIGTTYGTGDGSTTFNVPDMQEKFPLGKGGTHALGATGGATTHTHGVGSLTLASHTHTIPALTVDAHVHYAQPGAGSGVSTVAVTVTAHTHMGQVSFGAVASPAASEARTSSSTWTKTHVINASGSGGSGTQAVGNSSDAASTNTTSVTGYTDYANVNTITGSGGTTSGPTGNAVGGTLDNATGPIDPFVTVNFIIKL